MRGGVGWVLVSWGNEGKNPGSLPLNDIYVAYAEETLFKEVEDGIVGVFCLFVFIFVMEYVREKGTE